MFKFLFEYQQYLNNIENSDDEYIYNEILKRTKFDRLTLVEGLIYTYPIEKSVNILKRRFPELNIEVESDGEIFIQGFNDSINKYIPLITNIGYFISKSTINGKDWNIKFNNTDNIISAFIEAKYDYEIKIPSILFHASPIRYKDKILKYGLSPKSGNKLSMHPNRIYLTDNLDNAILFGEYVANDEKNEFFKNGYCIYSIDGNSISKLYSDINFREGGYYTLNNIKPEYIKLIKICEK